MRTFKLDLTANSGGTHRIGEIALSPARLVARFGPPRRCDEYKVSGLYAFTDDLGNVYTLYDWKATTLYNDHELDGYEPILPTPEKFWSNPHFAEFSIGGRDDCDIEAFSNWLAVEVKA